MLIRPAGPADDAAVAELTIAAFDAFLLGPDDPYAERLRDTAVRRSEAEIWVAVGDDGTVVGSVTWCPAGSPWREIARDDEGEFRMLAVHPRAQGLGVGRRLVEACVERARADGRAGLALCSLPTQTSAHALYRSVGFERDPADDWTPVPGVDLWAFRVRWAG